MLTTFVLLVNVYAAHSLPTCFWIVNCFHNTSPVSSHIIPVLLPCHTIVYYGNNYCTIKPIHLFVRLSNQFLDLQTNFETNFGRCSTSPRTFCNGSSLLSGALLGSQSRVSSATHVCAIDSTISSQCVRSLCWPLMHLLSCGKSPCQ